MTNNLALRTFTIPHDGREYHSTVEVRRETDGYWSVYVNGQHLVDRESFALAERIAEGLVTPGIHWPSEADDVSESIRRWTIGERR